MKETTAQLIETLANIQQNYTDILIAHQQGYLNLEDVEMLINTAIVNLEIMNKTAPDSTRADIYRIKTLYKKHLDKILANEDEVEL